jgi:hypothetical protein
MATMTKSSLEPIVDHDVSYTKYQRLALALSHYHADLRKNEDLFEQQMAYLSEERLRERGDSRLSGQSQNSDLVDEPQNDLPAHKVKKPNVSRLAKVYGITESMLRRHIKNKDQKTLVETHEEAQVLTVSEEKVLVERLLFLDDFNVPADRDTFYELAHSLLHRRDSSRQLGRDWLHRFLSRHPECRYILVETIDTNRANAESWDIMDDFFGKVCHHDLYSLFNHFFQVCS